MDSRKQQVWMLNLKCASMRHSFTHSFKPAAAIYDPPAKEDQRQSQQDAPQQRQHKACARIEGEKQKPEHFALHVNEIPYAAILTRIGRDGSKTWIRPSFAKVRIAANSSISLRHFEGQRDGAVNDLPEQTSNVQLFPLQ